MNNNEFAQDKRYMLKNPPPGINIGAWVERITDYGNKTVTKGKKYRVRNYFRYLNHYGQKGDRYCLWDEFITIKNDNGYTVKMNLNGFKKCEAPKTEIQKLKERIIILENKTS